MALHPLRQRTTEIDSHRHDRAAPSGEAFVPVQTTYPGVYIVEQKSGSHVITGVSTSVTAFVGAARKGISDTPVALTSFADYVRTFGDVMDTTHPMGHSVGLFFANGGSRAVIVRALGGGAAEATLPLPVVNGLLLTLTARSRGGWANGTGIGSGAQTGLFVEVTAADQFPDDRFNLVIAEWTPGVGGGPASILAKETWGELSMSPGSLRYVQTVLAASSLVTAGVAGVPAPAPGAGTSTGTVTVATSVTVSGKAIR